MSRRLLFVSHEATRTGAPNVALCLVARLAESFEVALVLRASGPRYGDFVASPASTVRIEPLRVLRVLLRRRRRTQRLANRLDLMLAGGVLRRTRPDVVYLNTVKSSSYVGPALRRGCRVYLHVHESGDDVVTVLARYDVPAVIDQVDVVVCSESARREFEAKVGRARSIHVVPSLVDVALVRAMAAAAPTPFAGSSVGACGVPNKGKGFDQFAAIAAKTRSSMPQVRFFWLGGASALDPASGVEVLPAVENPYPYLAGLTVFALPSERDTFPLVVLEAMALGTPVVAFGVGGVPEQLGSSGIVVPPGDVAGFASTLERLVRSPERREELARAAGTRVEELYDISRLADYLPVDLKGEVPTAGTG